MQDWNAWWFESAIAIQLELRPSPTSRRVMLVLCALTLGVVLAAVAKGLLLWWHLPLALIPLLLELLRERMQRTQRLVINPEKQIFENVSSSRVEILKPYDWWVHPWLIAVWVRPEGARFRSRVLLFWHDSIPVPEHRALRRWLRQLSHQGNTGSV